MTEGLAASKPVGVEPFVGFGEPPSYPVERVAFSSAMSQRFVLDAAADFVETLVGHSDHVKRVGNLASVGQYLVVGHLKGSGHVMSNTAQRIADTAS